MYLQAKRRRRGLGQLDPASTVAMVTDLWGSIPNPFAENPNYQPIWSEQAYVPGAVNPDPSVNTNPSPTLATTANDLWMVATDPLAQNPTYNASDTPATGLGNFPGSPSISTWVYVVGAVAVGLLLVKFVK
jgi:hypothetical protein